MHHLLLLLLNIYSLNPSFDTLWENDFSQIPALAGYQLFPAEAPSFMKGDFFGDGISDWAFLAKDSIGQVHLIYINEGEKRQLHWLGKEDDPFNLNDYSWAQVFQKAPAGSVLWANYVDGHRDFKEVPESEKVILEYDALYLHLREACGGGFIYWQNGDFHWLQQE